MKEQRKIEIERTLTSLRLVPVVSLPSVDAGLRLAEILMRCNLPVAEITMRTPYAAEGIAAMKRDFKEILFLAGTVLSIEQLDAACLAGAECIVTPGVYAPLVEHCITENIMVCPGTFTPSEILQCRNMGVQLVKFFPAELAGGVAMLKAISAVFGDMRFMPTGGITHSNMTDYLALETVSCCGGSWLAPEQLMREGHWNEIEARIKLAVGALKRK
jgi:2-dehydro-3-deoxyphosphogluconate aldolase / (4S)-4-hydroxy-2-oxoglutarate aldolase